MSEELRFGTVWRDRKGGIYVITGHCRIDATFAYGVMLLGVGVGSSTTWVCPIEEFVGGRFTNIDLRSEFSTAREEGYRDGRLAGLEEAATYLESQSAKSSVPELTAYRTWAHEVRKLMSRDPA